ncbi:MAG: hypothetical protein EA341_13015 [Mongoliibacter sp.]|uniref:ligand-binding sensor domain-containing protein n=1 Tax=Mongoliibacter sp. TaxID=2022438 RepID=UPI0012F36ECF|nr:sensor histidine kinase [Mongoliibacter sp.]TVP47132.1 MAG: hypothetical protein EA341_13015 [Mongoliibacter sp.]
MKVFNSFFSIPKRIVFTMIVWMLFLSLPRSGFCQVSDQKPDLKFQRIFEGLTNNRVSAIYQDSYGYIWVGTYSGLHKYDGLGFQVYAASNDPSSINDNYIGFIFEDSKKQLWIGTGSGVARYKRDTDDFTRFKFITDIPVQKGESNLVNTILEDANGTIWVSSPASGLFYFDKEKDKLIPFQSDKIISINAMVATKGNIFWLATSHNGLLQLNTATGKEKYFTHDPTDTFSISSNDLKAVEIDSEGNLWAGASVNGLNRMEINDGKVSFIRYYHDPENQNSLFNNNIYKIYVDRKGNLWTCNENGGLHLYDKGNDSFVRYLHDPKNPTSLTHNSIWNIFQDSQDRYWVGTAQSGINMADPFSSKFKHYSKNILNSESLNNDIIRDFLETKNGNIWIATDGGGLNYFDRENGVFKYYKNDPYNPNSLRTDAVISLNEDFDGKLWVGTWDGGLNILLDEKNGVFTSFNRWIKNDNYPIRHVFDVHFDEDYIWIAAFEEGLYRYDKGSEELELFSSFDNNTHRISSNQILRIFEDSGNNLWIGTQSGLNLIRSEDKKSGKFNVYLPSEMSPNSIPSSSIRQIFEDSNKNIWIATDRGLAKYLPDQDSFFTYQQVDGLPTNEINSIVEDSNGFLWIGTIKGISKFDPKKVEFVNFDKYDGLQGNEFSRYSALKTQKGELLFGGMNGFNLFHPEELHSNPHAPQVYLTDLKIFNKPVDFKSSRAVLSKHIAATDTLKLSFRENVFTLDFVALNYTNSKQNQYAYILEGFEKEWNYVGSQRNATYTNLNPGKYVFRVKAANSDGVWNEAGTSLVLVITPPFWKTAWFFVLVTLFIVACLITIDRLRIRAIKQQNKLLENMVEERTTMLLHTNSELKNHIKEKDKLFSIIGHDLRNPFVSIIGYLEILEEEFEDTKNDEQLKYIKYLLNVSRNTHNLLENLLQWASKKTKVYEVKAEVIKMTKLIDTAISMTSPQAGYKSITLEKCCPENIYIHADQNMLLTVLRNLISNAIKFSEPKSKIEIIVNEKSEEVMISVKDYGMGMDSKVLDRLFSKSDIQKPGTMGEFGTGLGLVLCREIVQKHEGKIWVESTLGKGSTFHFSLAKYELKEMAV